MNTFINKIASSVSIGLDAEIYQQCQLGKTLVTALDVARVYTAKVFPTLPQLINQTFIEYADKRKTIMKLTKTTTELNEVLWLLALQTILDSGFATYAGVTAVFTNWIDNFNIKIDNPAPERWAKMYLNSIKQQNIIHNVLDTVQIRSLDTITEIQAFKIQQPIIDALLEIHVDLESKTPMRCKPLDNKPYDWISREYGIGNNTNIPLISNPSQTQREIPQLVLDAVNKLQCVGFARSPVIFRALRTANMSGHLTEDQKKKLDAIKALSDSTMYFPLTMDKRGRMYARGGISTYQGEDFEKATYQFAVKRKLGKHGFSAIQIQVANCLGYDKLSMRDRITAIQHSIDAGLLDIKTIKDLRNLYPQADLYQAFVAVHELRSAIQWIDAGHDIQEFQSGLICHRDGTANGIQHTAGITGNLTTAKAVNCTPATPDTTPSDIYDIISKTAIQLTDDDNVRMCLIQFGRSITKKPIMIHVYGAGKNTLAREIREFLIEKDYTQEVNVVDLAEVIMGAIEKQAPAVKILSKSISEEVIDYLKDAGVQFPKTMNDPDIPFYGNINLSWETADGFPVDIEYRDTNSISVKAGNLHLTKRNESAPLNKMKMVTATSPNFIHSIDATHVRMVALACDWELATVHDSIGSHAATFFDTGRIIRTQYVKLHNYSAIGNLHASLNTYEPEYDGDYDIQTATDAIYMFS